MIENIKKHKFTYIFSFLFSVVMVSMIISGSEKYFEIFLKLTQIVIAVFIVAIILLPAYIFATRGKK